MKEEGMSKINQTTAEKIVQKAKREGKLFYSDEKIRNPITEKGSMVQVAKDHELFERKERVYPAKEMSEGEIESMVNLFEVNKLKNRLEAVKQVERQKELWEEYQRAHKVLIQETEILEEMFKDFHKVVDQKKEEERIFVESSKRAEMLNKALYDKNCASLYSKEELENRLGKTMSFLAKISLLPRVYLESCAETLARKESESISDNQASFLESIFKLTKELDSKYNYIKIQNEKYEAASQRVDEITAQGSSESENLFKPALNKVRMLEAKDDSGNDVSFLN